MTALTDQERADLIAALDLPNLGRDLRAARDWLRDRAGDAHQQTWDRAPYDRGRTSIYRELRIDPDDQWAWWAIAPFRIVVEDGRNWIAGAIGSPRWLQDDDIDSWSAADIVDIILWHPTTGELRVLGEAKRQTLLIHGDHPGDEITIYADGRAFFRAWADARAAFAARYADAIANPWQVRPTEPRDNCVTGALVVGNVDRVDWRSLDAGVLHAGPGVDATQLQRAIRRQFRVPKVVAATQEVAA